MEIINCSGIKTSGLLEVNAAVVAFLGGHSGSQPVFWFAQLLSFPTGHGARIYVVQPGYRISFDGT